MSKFEELFAGLSPTQSAPDYTSLTGSELINNGSFLEDLRTYYSSKGQTFANTSDMLDDWYTDNRWKDSNFISAGLDMMEYNNAGSDQALMTRLSKAWRSAPTRGTVFERVKDYGLATVADPINFVPYAGAASKAARVAKTARAAGATKGDAVKKAVRSGAARGAAIEGTVGTGIGTGFEALQQTRQIQQGIRDEYDAADIAKVGALEGVLSAGIGAPIGALASRAPAQRALDWRPGTPLSEKLDSRLTELTDLERIARANASDDTLAPELRADAEDDLLDIEKERADVQQAVNKVVALDNQLEGKAKTLTAAQAKGDDVTALKAEYDQEYKVFEELLNSTDVERAARLDNAAIAGNRAAETAARATKPTVTDAEGMSVEEAKALGEEAQKVTGTKAGDAADDAADETSKDLAEAGAEGGEAEEPTFEVMELPKSKPVKFKLSDAQKTSLNKTLGKDFATHKNKVKKANEKNGTDYKPLTQKDLEVIVGSVDGGVNKKGVLTRVGNQAIRSFIANREGRVSKLKVRKPDEASFTDPTVAAQKNAAEGKTDPDAPEIAEVSEAADAVFYDLVRSSGYYEHLRAQKVRNYVAAAIQAAADDGTPFDPEIIAAVRRRVDLLDNEGGETYLALKNQQKVADFKTKLSAKAGSDDLKFTAGRVADRTQKSGEALAFDKYAGRVFQNFIDPKTGEKRTTSKINKLFRRGLDVGDGRTITEGADMLQRRNETREAARARAEMDLNNGKLRAVYSFAARAGMRLRGNVNAKEGQVVYGTLVRNVKSGNTKFEVYTTEAEAKARAGLQPSNKKNPIIIVDDSKGITVREDFERMMDEAEKSFTKHADVDRLEEEQSLIEAKARKGGLEVDEEVTKVVDGRGNDVTEVQTLPDVPTTRDDMVLIILPKTLERKARVISEPQILRGDGLAVLLGKDTVENYNIGYVPREVNGKRPSNATDRDILKSVFVPFDEKNSIGAQPAPKEVRTNVPKGPMNYEDIAATVVDIKRLASTPEGKQLANRLWIGSRLVDSGVVEETLDDFLASQPSIGALNDVLNDLEGSDWRTFVGGQEVDFERKLDSINAYLEVIGNEAPFGIRKPTQGIQKSVDQLRKLATNLNKTQFAHVERMIRAISPSDRAPIFERLKNYDLSVMMDDNVNGLYSAKAETFKDRTINSPNYMENLQAEAEGAVIMGDDFNRIFLDPDKMDRDGTKTGITGSFTIMHELGHWAYDNLMTPELKREFWEQVGEYYYANGKFDGGFVSDRVEGTLLDAHSPLVQINGKSAGVANAKQNAAEVFANQFATYAHHKYNAPIAPMSFFDKAADLIKKLWNHITNRHFVSKEYEAIFEKMIANKDEALRTRFTNPKDASSKLGKALQARYMEIREGIHAFKAAREGYPDLHDPAKLAFAARSIANAFSSITMTQRARGIAARRSSVDGKITPTDTVLIGRYTGAFKAIKGHKRMSDYAKQINEITASTDYTVSEAGDDSIIGGSVFHSDMEKDIIELWDKGLERYSEGKLDEINEAYLDIEYGDIPEAKLSDVVLSLRQANSFTPAKIEKIKNFEQKVKRVTNLNRAKFKKTMQTIMQDQGKVNAREFAGEVTKSTKGNDLNNYSLAEALSEYRRQIGKDGKPTEFGKKLSNRVKHLVNTETKDVVLTQEEQAIFNKMQSKEKTGGNQGIAVSVQQPEITLGLAMSADGQVIKGFGASPEQATNILKHLMRTRKQARKARQSTPVSNAIIIEQSQDMGTSFENGIPSNATMKMREYLRGITHRSNDTELAARTVTARMARLGSESLPQSIDANSYSSYRKAVRTAATNLQRSDDVTQAITFVGEALYSSNVITHASRNVLSKASQVLNISPEKLFADTLAEVNDINSSKPQLKSISRIMDGEDADLFDDFLEELEQDASEAAGYVLNGMIKSPVARERFSGITAYGDMIGSANPSKGSPRTRFVDRVPAEFAEDFSHEIISDYTASGYAAVREFTGDSVIPFYRDGVRDGVFGSGQYVTRAPSNTMENVREALISSAPVDKKEDATELVDQISLARAKINTARLDNSSSSAHIDKLYTMDDLLSEELQGLGVEVSTTVEPVFVRDTTPAVFIENMAGSDDLITTLIGQMRSLGKNREANDLDAITGVHTAEEMARKVVGIMGGVRKFKKSMQEAGFTSVNLGDVKMMLSNRNVRNIRSDVFEASTPVIGEGSQLHSVNGRIIQAVEGDNTIRVINQAAGELEEAGVPARTLEAMVAVARGRGMPADAAAEIRKSNIYNPFRTNSKIMNRSGIRNLANFFEPTDGSGGHFERTNARMGKFIIPLTKMLKELPDSKNKLTNYFRTGPQMMAESAMGAMGINPRRRMTQPASHLRIISALRDANKVGELDPSERITYDHVRGYLDEATGRLRASGALVGNLKKNYFPQVWRKDLIQADPEEFVRRLKKYFLAERNGTGEAAKAEAAARRVMQRLTDEDGVYSNPAQNFKRNADKAGDQSDHLDYTRLIRLDEFPEFADMDVPDSLGVFLENDLLVAMTKYSDNLEHRIDISEKFGVGAHGYHDYMAILSQPMNARQAIGKLLSSNKIITTNWTRSGMTDHGTKTQTFRNDYFYAPIKNKFEAEQKAQQLIDMARDGKTAPEIEANIMELLGDRLDDNPDAELLRNNFKKRASAIASALGDTKGLTDVPSNRNLQHAQGFMNSAMRRPIDGVHGTFSMRNASKWLRGVNAVTLLGFTTLTSLGDLVLPLVRTGDMGAYVKSLRKFAVDPEYRDMIRNIGAATENAVHQRLTVAHGVDSTQFMTGFFNATLLTPWTDMMRDVAAAVSYEHVKAQHRILKQRPNSRAGRIARRILNEEGLGELVQDQSLDLDMIMESRFTNNEHPMADKVSASMIKLTNQMIFTPNPNDIPLWAQTPLGAIAFQLKSYPLMMTRLINTVAGEAFRGNTTAERGANFAKAFVGQSDNRLAPLAALLVAGPAMGGIAVGTKDIIQGRGGEDNREFTLRERKLSETLTTAFEENEDMDMLMGWYFDGMIALGGLGLIGELMYDIASQSDNGAYGAQRNLETIGGPTVGLFNDATTVLQGARSWWDQDDTNGEKRAAVREVVGRVPVLGGVSWAKEGIVDSVAGERSKKGGSKSGWGNGWG